MGRNKDVALPLSLRAFTLLELLLVIAIVALLAALLLPAIQKGWARGRQAHCLGQLKQIGTAFHLFAQDHGDRLPMQLAPAAAGLLRPPTPAEVAAVAFPEDPAPFRALSNELKTPHLLVCRADRRQPAETFARLEREQVSYRVGRWATLAEPQSALAVDRNLTNLPASVASGSNRLEVAAMLAWTPALHDRRGNLLFADGRVELRRSFLATVPTAGGGRPGPVTVAPTVPGRTDSTGSSARATESSEPAPAGDSAGSISARATGASGRLAGPTRWASAPEPVPGTNGATRAVAPSVEPGDAPQGPWDTELFRLVLGVVRSAYLLSLLIALLILLGWAIVMRRRQAGSGRR